MTPIRTKLLLAGIAAGGALLAAAPAHADDMAFLTDVKAAGFYTDTGNGPLVEAGEEVCAMLSAGNPPAQVARIVFERSGASSLGSATMFVAIAQHDLCTTGDIA